MEWIRQLAAIGLVFGLLAAALWALRRRGIAARGPWLGARKAGKRLVLVERLALSPQHSLHLVRLGERELLIGTHAGGCAVLESMPPAPAASFPKTFAAAVSAQGAR